MATTLEYNECKFFFLLFDFPTILQDFMVAHSNFRAVAPAQQHHIVKY